MRKCQPNQFIIADHLRTVIFALADGAIIGAKKRGYILKKLVKRGVLFAYFLNIEVENLLQIIKELIKVNSAYYIHLKKKKELLINTLKEEISKEIKFIVKAEKELENLYSLYTNAKDIFF